MANMVERDPVSMKRFASEIDEYAENMRAVCRDLIADMESARPFMKDEPSKKAHEKIEAFVDNLINSLPEAQHAAEKLRESAKYLDDALSIQM